MAVLTSSAILLLAPAFTCCIQKRTRAEVTSPDGEYVATWSIVDPGATASTVTLVNVRQAGSIQSIYIGRVFEVHRGYDIGLRWQRGTLEIVCEYCGPDEAEVKEANWNDLRIAYPRYGEKHELVVYSRKP